MLPHERKTINYLEPPDSIVGENTVGVFKSPATRNMRMIVKFDRLIFYLQPTTKSPSKSENKYIVLYNSMPAASTATT